jgi:TolB-like protein
MSSLFQELRRRNVFRVAVAYLVLAWVVLQITDLVAPALHLPDWTMTLVVFLGIVGFPFALLFAWAFELTPEGIKRTEDVEPGDSITGSTASRLNQATTALLLLAVVILLLDRQMGLSERWSADRAPAQASAPAAGAAPAGQAEAVPAGDSPRSIAVLPFVNMSGDSEQEYFSDGISEELLNALAQIRELRVAARTSSFAFKGRNQDITEIGERLKVSTVLEGSVRKSGQRVRITAQLINVEDGYHLWSETYDRDLVDIFAVQDEISAAIVNALKVHLTATDEPGARSPVDVQAYNFVLQARHNVRMRTRESLELALRQFRQALDIDENYAQAWAGMAIATSLLRESQYGDIPDEESYRVAQGYLDRAFAIDADLFEAHAGQALVYLERDDPEKGLAAIDRALAINPSEGVLYLWQSFFLDRLGRFNASTLALERAFAVDPLHPSIRITWPGRLAELGRGEEAQRLLTPGTYEYYRAQWLIARAEGRWADQYRYVAEALQQGFSEGQREIIDRLRFHTEYFELYVPDPVWPATDDHFQGLLRVLNEPDPVIARLLAREAASLDREEEHHLVVALLEKGMCEEVVALLGERELEGRSRFRATFAEHSDEFYAVDLAWCLSELGEQARAGKLANALLAANEQALADGLPLHWLNLDYVFAQVAAGDAAGAVATLEARLASGHLHYRDHNLWPHFRSLQGREDYQALKVKHLEKVNAERAALGWPAVQDTGL